MTLKIDPKSPLHRRILTEVTGRIKMAEAKHGDQHKKWYEAERRVQAFVPESTDDAKRASDRDNRGNPHYTTIMIPYSYALLMAAHTYWTSVFFGRSPVLQFEGRHGETQNQTQALEAVVAYQTQVGRHLGPYYLWAYDAGKYGVGILGTYWDRDLITYTTLGQDPETGEQVYITNQIPGYTGNKVYNVSPWDFLPDPRTTVREFQQGEFCALYRTIPWHDLKRKQSQGYYTNVDKLLKGVGRPFAPRGSSFIERPSDKDSLSTYTDRGMTTHPAWVGVYEIYVTLIPDEWGLGGMQMPEKWVFTVTADCEYILQAQPLGTINNQYPFDVWQPEPEAYGLWNRGIPEIVAPLQNTMDWLINSHFFNVRANSNGRYVYDPSKIDASQLEEGEPGWIAALKPEAWGMVPDLRQVFMQLPTSDTTAMHMQDFERVFQIGERVTGINEQILGALSGGRKTATEVRTSTGFGTNRLKTASEFMSVTGFADHGQRLVQYTQQYMEQPMTVKIIGDLAQFTGPQFVQVSPQDIAGFFDYVPVDGTLPVDRFAQATLWKDMMGQLSQMPQLMMQFDMGKIFTWVAGLAGLKNLNQMRIQGPLPVQVLPDDQLAQQAEAGNVIPYPGGAPRSGAPPQSNVATIPTNNVAQ